jgi:hypothetical protein
LIKTWTTKNGVGKIANASGNPITPPDRKRITCSSSAGINRVRDNKRKIVRVFRDITEYIMIFLKIPVPAQEGVFHVHCQTS